MLAFAGLLHRRGETAVVVTDAARRMVDALVEQGLVRDPRLERALLEVPREAFVREGDPHLDAPQPIGSGQTISAPHMVAMMVDALDVQPHHRVLEVGGGSGYHAAVLARLARHVVSVEVVPELAERARRTLDELGVTNVDLLVGDGSKGHPPGAPYDRISVAAGAPSVPPPLLDQLAPEGILVIPVGPMAMQWLMRVDKRGRSESVCAVRFVPLVGKFGWPA